MKRGIIFSLFGLGVVLALALVWARARAATQSLIAERGTLRRADAELVTRRAVWERRSIEIESSIAERKRTVLATQSAAERARVTVGPLVARLKAAHAGLKPTRPPDPPTPAGGASYFPELMSDPEYSALYTKSTRAWMASCHGPKLRRLGLTEEVVARAVDLLTEEQVSLADVHNLAGSSPLRPPSGEFNQMQQQIREETQVQLKALLGEDAYRRYKDANVPFSDTAAGFAVRSLERRLSYSEEPLSSEQIARLQTFEAARYASAREYFQQQRETDREARKMGAIPSDEAKLAFYRSVLTPRQMEAVDELHREREAALKRDLLPKYQEKKATGVPR